MNKVIVVTMLALAALMQGCSQESSTPTAANPAEESAGALIVKANCKVCHAQGINGAPIIGNKKMWGSRTEKGIPQLVTNAANGIGLMPAKGGNAELTEDEITLAVTYMLEQLK